MNARTSPLRSWPSLLACLTALWLSGCGGGSSPADPDTAQTVQATGLVVDDQGIPVTGAKVTVVSASTVAGADQTVNTDSSGQFALTLDAATPAVLRVDKAGYSRGFSAAARAADNATVASRVVLLPVASTQTFDPTQDAVLRVPGSAARVTLSAGSLVREDGQAISGTTQVALTPIDPSADIARMPGLMVDSGSGEPIESLGAMSVQFSDASGAPLNLAAGRTAVIRIPATPAAGASGALPATFPLYHLNETTGRWTPEGTATLQTDPATGTRFYEGTVSHFSWWNSDSPYTRTEINLRAAINGASCVVPLGMKVEGHGLDYNGREGSGGNTLFLRAASQARVILFDALGNRVDAVDVSTGAVGATTPLPRCLTVPALVQLSGRVTVESGALDGYWVQIQGEKLFPFTVPIDAQGGYSTRVSAGSGVLQARLVDGSYGAPDTRVSTTVDTTDAVFPDLVVRDTSFSLSGCVQGWGDYRQSGAALSVFRGNTLLASRSLRSTNATFSMTVPLNSTLTLRLTPPDASLAEKVTTVVVGNTPVTLGACLDLPKGPTAQMQVVGTELSRSVDGSASVAGDAAITRYDWSFGDGSSGSGASAAHTYAAVGSYAVSLTVTDALGQQSSRTVPVIVASGGGVTPSAGRQIDSGAFHTCSLTAAGGVACVGYDGYGQLGGGALYSDPQPVAVTGLSSGVVEVAAGGDFSCALTSAGGVKCWGDNSGGQLGMGSTLAYSATPVNVVGLGSGVVAISAASGHACAITSAGAMQCWGRNDHGQLGTGDTVQRRAPVAVPSLSSGVRLVSAGATGTCAVTRGAGVYCWGFGYGEGGSASSVPVLMAGLADSVVSLSLGFQHGCAVTAAGGVQCWGSNNGSGELGDGSVSASQVPVNVVGLTSGFVAVSSSDRFSCALSGTGATYCWGTNGQGQLGNGGTTGSSTPVLASEQSGTAIGVSTRGYATCILRADRSTACWGWLDTYAPGG